MKNPSLPSSPIACCTLRFRTWTLVLGVLVLGSSLPDPASAQNTSQFGMIEDWKIVEYQDPGKTPDANRRQLKTVLAGARAQPQRDGVVQVFEMQLDNYRPDGTTNIIARSPECMSDPRNRTVWSEKELAVTTANGQLSIQGLGFFCSYSNVVLVISNQVNTTIHRGMLKPGAAPSLTRPEGTNASPMKIFSDHFKFDQQSNLIVYSGNVRVADPQLNLQCDQLLIGLDTNGTVHRITAQTNVVISSQDSPSQAKGNLAIYHLNDDPNLEYVELLGSPATWEDGPRRGQGQAYLYSPKSGRMTAKQLSTVRIPRSDLMQPSLDPRAAQASPAQPETDETNRYVEISALYMDFLLQPPTNSAKPNQGRSLMASNQVVITSASDQSQAQGNLATFEEETGIFELSGNALWTTGDRLVKGRTLQFDSTNQVFRALEDSYLKLPVSMLGDSPAISGWLSSAPENPALAIQHVEIFSRNIEYKSGFLRFSENVRGHLNTGNATLGNLTCHTLTLSSNRIGQLIVAEQDVFLEQLPLPTETGNPVTKSLRCQYAAIQISTNGLIRTMTAQTNALMRQVEQSATPNTPPTLTELKAQIITATFAAHTNQVQSVVAEQDVEISQTSGRARGDRAIYSRETDSLELQGNVTLESGKGRMISAPAAILKHFGLWPGKLNRLTIPARNRNRPDAAQP